MSVPSRRCCFWLRGWRDIAKPLAFLGSQLKGWGDMTKPLPSLGCQWKQLRILAKVNPSISQLCQALKERHTRMKMPL